MGKASDPAIYTTEGALKAVDLLGAFENEAPDFGLKWVNVDTATTGGLVAYAVLATRALSNLTGETVDETQLQIRELLTGLTNQFENEGDDND